MRLTGTTRNGFSEIVHEGRLRWVATRYLELYDVVDFWQGDPNPVTCEPDLPEDIYLSAEMPAEEQADVIE